MKSSSFFAGSKGRVSSTRHMCDGGQSVPIATLGGEFLSNFYVSLAPKANKEPTPWHVRFVPRADMKSFDDLVGDLVAPYRIDTGIPSNRDAKGEHEGRC